MLRKERREVRKIDNELWVRVFKAFKVDLKDPENYTEEELYDMLALVGGIRACYTLRKESGK